MWNDVQREIDRIFSFPVSYKHAVEAARTLSASLIEAGNLFTQYLREYSTLKERWITVLFVPSVTIERIDRLNDAVLQRLEIIGDSINGSSGVTGILPAWLEQARIRGEDTPLGELTGQYKSVIERKMRELYEVTTSLDAALASVREGNQLSVAGAIGTTIGRGLSSVVKVIGQVGKEVGKAAGFTIMGLLQGLGFTGIIVIGGILTFVVLARRFATQ